MAFSRRTTHACVPSPIVLGAAILLATVGCESSASIEAESQLAPTPPTPEEQFENIVAVLREKVQDPAIRGGSAEPNFGSEPGTPVTDWSTTVSHQFLPTEEAKPRRAVITISTKSTITVVLPQENDDGEGANNSAEKSANALPKVEGMPDFEALMVPAGGAQRLGRTSIKTLPGEKQTRLGFEHRDSKWVLVTPIDTEEEPFTAAAVQYALRRQ